MYLPYTYTDCSVHRTRTVSDGLPAARGADIFEWSDNTALSKQNSCKKQSRVSFFLPNENYDVTDTTDKSESTCAHNGSDVTYALTNQQKDSFKRSLAVRDVIAGSMRRRSRSWTSRKCAMDACRSYTTLHHPPAETRSACPITRADINKPVTNGVHYDTPPSPPSSPPCVHQRRGSFAMMMCPLMGVSNVKPTIDTENVVVFENESESV